MATAAVAAAAGPTWDARCRTGLERAAADGFEATDLPALALAVASRDLLADRTALDTWVERAESAAADPLVRAAVGTWRSRLDLEAGRLRRARERFAAAGGVTRWWAWGPRPIEELADVGALEPPPAGAAWRRVPGTDATGWVRLEGLGWPGARQVIYLGAHLISSRERAVAIRLGAAEAARVWLNGREVLTTPHPLRRAPDQHAAGAWLRRGDNALVVAVAVERGGWWVRVRLTTPEGEPLPLPVGEGPPPVVAPLRRDPPPVRTLRAQLEAAAEAGAPGARLALATLLLERRPDPVDSGSAKAAARAARGDDPVLARWLELGGEDEPGARRELLAAILERDPAFLPARLQLAGWLADRGLWLAARRLLEASDEPAARAALRDLGVDRWGALAVAGLERVASAAPRCVRAQVLLGRRAVEQGLWRAAARACWRLLEVAPEAPRTRALARRVARAGGDQERLLRLAAHELEVDPGDPEARRRLARLLVAAGREGEARRVLAEGVRACPTDPDLVADLAEVEHRLGEDEAARARLAALLETRPQDRRARRLLTLLGRPPERPEWAREPAALRALAPAGAEGPYVALLHHHEVRLLPDNLVEERVQRAWLVRDPRRAEALRQVPVVYVPERERLTVLAARVVRSDGASVEARMRDTPRLAEPEVNLYYDTRVRVFEMPPLEAGDLVELTYVRTETAESNDTGAYRGGVVPLAGPVPTGLVEAILEAPREELPAWRVVGLPDRPRRTAVDGRDRLAWSWREVPAVPADTPPAPGLAATPYLVYSTRADWSDLAAWYARHVEPRVRAGAEVVAKARELTAGARSRRERIERVYRFVADRIRYVGLEFGEHRFRPFSAAWVLRHRMGDCKDKAGLLVALLGAAGIPARMVLLRTADLGPAPEGVATLESFDHAIAYLPEDDLWLDGTASGQAVGALPGPDRGAVALVVEPGGGRLVTTPDGPAGEIRRRLAVRRADDGRLEVRLEHRAWGDPATALRGELGGTRDPHRLERWLQRLLPGAALEGEPETVLEPGQDPALVRLAARVPASALEAAGGLTVYPGHLDLVGRLAPVAARRSPLRVPALARERWTVEVDLGRAPRRLPPAATLESRFGRFTVSVTPLPRGYRVEGELEVRPGLVAPGDVPALRRFLLAAERAGARRGELP